MHSIHASIRSSQSRTCSSASPVPSYRGGLLTRRAMALSDKTADSLGVKWPSWPGAPDSWVPRPSVCSLESCALAAGSGMGCDLAATGCTSALAGSVPAAGRSSTDTAAGRSSADTAAAWSCTRRSLASDQSGTGTGAGVRGVILPSSCRICASLASVRKSACGRPPALP